MADVELVAGPEESPVRGVDPAFWDGRSVLLTGHTGFKGAWLSLWLQSLGADVTGFSSGVPTEPSLFELARVREGMESIEGDVRDREALIVAVEAARPEVVIHMAAQSLVRRSFAEPTETYATNVMHREPPRCCPPGRSRDQGDRQRHLGQVL